MNLKEFKEKHLIDLMAVLLAILIVGAGILIIKNSSQKEEPIEIIQNEEE